MNDRLNELENRLVDREYSVALDYIISKRYEKGKLKRPELLDRRRNNLTVKLKNAIYC